MLARGVSLSAILINYSLLCGTGQRRNLCPGLQGGGLSGALVFAARYGVLPFTSPSAHTFSQTTLLKIIGGKHMVDKDCIRVLGRPPFHDTNLTVSGECDRFVPCPGPASVPRHRPHCQR